MKYIVFLIIIFAISACVHRGSSKVTFEQNKEYEQSALTYEYKF